MADVGDGEAALEVIDAHRPELAFLDIQMPELAGVEVARSIAANADLTCHMVFVTAFDQHAVEAFQTGAADYLLKPFSDDRLALTVRRLKERLTLQPPPAQDLQALVTQISAQLKPQLQSLRWIKASVIDLVTRDLRGQAAVRVRGRKETLIVSRPFSHLFRQM